MSQPYLTITKRMLTSHGKIRPTIEVRATISEAARALLVEQFPNETLFKRTAYASGFSDGGLQPSPPLARMLSNFVRNDACPEVTVKTLTSGQKYEGMTFWDVQCFDFIARRSFDALCELAAAAEGYGGTTRYYGFDFAPPPADLDVAHVLAGPAAVAVGGVQGMPDAA